MTIVSPHILVVILTDYIEAFSSFRNINIHIIGPI